MIKEIKFKHPTITMSIAMVIVGLFISLNAVNAEIGEEIIFPIKELGNCDSKNECKSFCDKMENIPTCVDFAERRNLMSKEEATKARSFARVSSGPGGCQNKDECEAFCNDSNNMETCLTFAEKNHLMDEAEMKEARQMSNALKEGVGLPGGCKNKKTCQAYCENQEHMDECMAFAEKAGLIKGDELENAKKSIKAMKSGIKPPGNCKEKGQCEAYCGNEANRDECAEFAVRAGFMKKEEFEMMKKTGGKGPGGCKGKDECEAFCRNPKNREFCFNFAKENGMIPKEEMRKIEQERGEMRKDKIIGREKMTGYGVDGRGAEVSGPGDCSNPEECRRFCSDPKHRDECEAFRQKIDNERINKPAIGDFEQSGSSKDSSSEEDVSSDDFSSSEMTTNEDGDLETANIEDDEEEFSQDATEETTESSDGDYADTDQESSISESE